jgi:uncharacterized RDD family membrane protein YckC
MAEACPLCRRDTYMNKPGTLYGYAVCKKCINGFANRRQIAWVVDVLLIRVTVFAVTFALGVAIGIIIVTSGGQVDEPVIRVLTMVDWGFVGLGLLLVAAKDGFGGYSPGKRLLGVHVVNENSGQPIGFGQSMARNWPALIPIMPIVIAVQMLKGKRVGDGMAGTRVIWDRHADSPVFAVGQPPSPPGLDQFALPQAAGMQTSNPYQSPRLH